MMRFCVLFAASLLPLAAQAGVLYKSVDANGTLTFSDMPPPSDAKILETRVISPGGLPQPVPAPAVTADPLVSSLQFDAAVARANEQVDQAERALALARRELWSPRDGLRLVDRRMTPVDDARVEFFKRNVAAARHSLMELLRDRRNQMVAAATRPGDGMPRYASR